MILKAASTFWHGTDNKHVNGAQVDFHTAIIIFSVENQNNGAEVNTFSVQTNHNCEGTNIHSFDF